MEEEMKDWFSRFLFQFSLHCFVSNKPRYRRFLIKLCFSKILGNWLGSAEWFFFSWGSVMQLHSAGNSCGPPRGGQLCSVPCVCPLPSQTWSLASQKSRLNFPAWQVCAKRTKEQAAKPGTCQCPFYCVLWPKVTEGTAQSKCGWWHGLQL